MDDVIALDTALNDLGAEASLGRLLAVAGASVRVSGLGEEVELGDAIEVLTTGGPLRGEVVLLERGSVQALLEGEGKGIRVGQGVRHAPRPAFRPAAHWLGRVIDPDGLPLDGRPLLPGPTGVPLDRDPPPANLRRGLGARLRTGYAVFNTLLPIVRGQRLGIFAGSGVGKSTLLGGLARTVEADVIVMALVGERGREVQEFVTATLGPDAMARTVVVAATSDRAPQVRRRCARSATAIAETFRDSGCHVLLLIDSVTRFCEAHREVAVAAGETANLRGHPASTANAIAHLCERAGPGENESGDITAIYTVLVAGSDMEEPVADMLRGVLDGHIVLSREIAERGRFPAIDVPRSVSRSLPAAASRVENELIAKARRTMATYQESALMIKAGLYQPGADADLDAAVAANGPLESFLSMMDSRSADDHFRQLKKILTESDGSKP